MKQYLLFAGPDEANLKGVQGLAGDFGSVAEAFVSLVDRQTPAEWWHILDMETGEVVERRHLTIRNGMIGFEHSDWVVGSWAAEEPTLAPAPPLAFTPGPAIATSLPKPANLAGLEADLRNVVGSVTTGHLNGKANGHADRAAAEH